VFNLRPFKKVNHITGLLHKCEKFIDVTGTPALNRPVEFYPLLSACAKQHLAPHDDYMSFGKYYCSGWKAPFGWVFTGSSNEEQLNRILRESVMIRRDKEKVLPQLPAKRFQIIEIDPKKVQNLLETEISMGAALNHLDWVAGLQEEVKAKNLKREGDERPLIAQLAEIKQELALSKIPQIVEIVEATAHAGEKILVFAVHKAVVQKLKEQLAEYLPAVVVGGQTKSVRDSEIRRFIQDKECKVIIGNIEALGVGVDGLQHVCSQIVFAEINHSPNVYGAIGQAIDRLCRRGQTSPVLARFIAYLGSLDQLMLSKNAHKEIILGKLLK
jgi:SWI/SNF-related matrix-associated actin-dependent regulator 1 of chromatin subfamily A